MRASTAAFVAVALLCCFALTAASQLPAEQEEYFEHNGNKWRVLFDVNSERNYYQNLRSLSVQWEDPRTGRGSSSALSSAEPRYTTAPDQRTVMGIVMAPMLLFFGALGGRIYYLAKYYPEALNPKKERKTRKKGWGVSHFRVKGANRMSQDGKGGRSANS